MRLRPRPHRSRGRSVVALYFVGFGLPLLLLGATLGVDLAQLVSEHRRVTNAAEAAAEAGALAIDQDTGTLDLNADDGLPRAWRQAVGTFDTARAIGAIRGRDVNPTVTFETSGGRPVAWGQPGATVVRVDVAYTNSRMIFLPAILGDDDGSSDARLALRTVGVASICQPGESSGPTGGVCTRPLR